MGENKDNQPTPLGNAGLESIFAHQLFEVVKQQLGREMEILEEKISSLSSKTEEEFENVSAQISKLQKDTKDQIDTVEGKQNSKLDGVDEALRGNGRIGIYEQLRNLRVQVKILIALILLLLGAKVMTLDIGEWTKALFPIHEKVPEVKVIQTTQPTNVKP
jgi:hypothetical protein